MKSFLFLFRLNFPFESRFRCILMSFISMNEMELNQILKVDEILILEENFRIKLKFCFQIEFH